MTYLAWLIFIGAQSLKWEAMRPFERTSRKQPDHDRAGIRYAGCYGVVVNIVTWIFKDARSLCCAICAG